MIPIIYKSVNTSAPVLTGQAGTLVALLDACLVTGYGSKAAAGWTQEFSAANQRVYRAPAGGPRHYYYIDDTSGQRAGMRGYRTQTALGVGGGAFSPTRTSGVQKSNTADAIARPWMLIADDRSLILLIDAANTASTNFQGYLHLLGEFYSLAANDGYRSLCGGDNFSSSFLAAIGGGLLGVARHSSQQGNPINMAIGAHRTWTGMISTGGSSQWMAAGWPFPNPADNGVHMTRLTLESGTYGLRGYVRGLWGVEHTGFSTDLSDLTDVDGAAGSVYAGRNFVMVQARSSNQSAFLAVESTTWDTN